MYGDMVATVVPMLEVVPGTDTPPSGRGAGEPSSPDTVRRYLRDIASTPLLSAQEEVALAIQIRTGRAAVEAMATAVAGGPEGRGASNAAAAAARDEQARLCTLANAGRRAMATLVTANLRLVVSVAKRYAGRGVPLLDLIQEGNLGLL